MKSEIRNPKFEMPSLWLLPAWLGLAALCFGGFAAGKKPHLRDLPIEAFAPTRDFEAVDDDWLLSWDGARRAPRYALERLTPKSFGTVTRGDLGFHHDANEQAEFPASPDDYNGFTALYDRGHCARASNHSRTQERMKRTFTIRNAMVQWKKLNEVGWKALEDEVAADIRPGDVVFVWTGPIFAPDNYPKSLDSREAVYTTKSIGLNHQQIPSHCGKSVLIIRANDDVEMHSWVVPNDDSSDDRPFSDFLVETNVLEGLAGENLWAILPDDLENKLEKRK